MGACERVGVVYRRFRRGGLSACYALQLYPRRPDTPQPGLSSLAKPNRKLPSKQLRLQSKRPQIQQHRLNLNHAARDLHQQNRRLSNEWGPSAEAVNNEPITNEEIRQSDSEAAQRRA
jgi:hypothetical protein